MFERIKKCISNTRTDLMRKDIEKFISRTKEAEDREIAELLVMANSLRLHLIETGQIPAAALDSSLPRDAALISKCEQCSETLREFIKETQKDSIPALSVGCRIWLHSIHALNRPDLRELGREMWSELKRGFPGTKVATAKIHDFDPEILHPNIERETNYVPRGLEPNG